MTFWTAQGADTKDPKRNFRFIVTFPGIGEAGNSVIWYAKKIDKPNFSVTEAKHSYLNHTFYYPGRVEWQKITMTLVDPVEPDLAAKFGQLMKTAGYELPGTANHVGTMSKAKFKTAIGGTQQDEIRIIQLQSAGDAGEWAEKWTLKQAFITNVKYGSLDYENDDLTELELEIRYDWAECIAADKTTICPRISNIFSPFRKCKTNIYGYLIFVNNFFLLLK